MTNTAGCDAQRPKSRKPTAAVADSKNLWENNLWELRDRTRAIDPGGRIEKVYRKVKPKTQAAQIWADLPDL
ncbi:hypothetical protein QT972_05035 [Microcoleus sp. herbarium7]|uniref:hypothetical protein n=1 Tax=Microcoleus sp. herbarium7 TaxID=3055435 RepID=UPI002FD35A89